MKRVTINLMGFTIFFGYCTMQFTLQHYRRSGYVSDKNGWAYDIYADVGNTGVNVITGYWGEGWSVTYIDFSDLPAGLKRKFEALEVSFSKCSTINFNNSEGYQAAIKRRKRRFEKLLLEVKDYLIKQ